MQRSSTQPAANRYSEAKAEILTRFPDQVSDVPVTLGQHANTLSLVVSEPPSVVVWAQTVQDVQAVVEIATRHRIPVIAFGAGTSLEGHVNAPAGGICLDMSRMNTILRVNVDDMDCEVEAGVTRRQLAAHLRDTGLFFPVDPGAEDATLGGMAATRASGTTTVRYGSMRDNVLGLSAVMADGSAITTGSRARKSAAGYDLTRLLVGSEGTLGIITSLTLRLHPVPEATVAAIASFSSLKEACDASIAALTLGPALARVELLDGKAIEAVNTGSKLSLTALPTLFFELHGTAVATAECASQLGDLVREYAALNFEWAADDEVRRRLWIARHDAFWSIREAWPGRTAVVTDVCVPVSKLAECVAAANADSTVNNLIAPIVGHAGDGNFHAIVMVDPNDAGEMDRLAGFLDRLIGNALAVGGTCTGEHGIGQGKIAALEREAGASLAVMRQIKNALDPLSILNPGKVFRPF